MSAGAVVFGVFALMQPAAAQKGPCTADVAKFCADVQRGGGRIVKCLKEHEAQLSDACKERMQRQGARRKGRRGACKDDIAKFCANVKRGGGAIRQCLKEHEADLSAACKDKLAQAGSRRAGRRRHPPAAATPSGQ